MKFVSPAQRGTTCRCTWSRRPAPATRPRFQPRLKPSGRYVSASAAIPRAASRCSSSASSSVELAELARVPHRSDQQVAGRVRELVQQDERALAAVHDQAVLVGPVERGAEEAALLLVGAPDVLEAPRRPQRPRHVRRQSCPASVRRKAGYWPALATVTSVSPRCTMSWGCAPDTGSGSRRIAITVTPVRARKPPRPASCRSRGSCRAPAPTRSAARRAPSRGPR